MAKKWRSARRERRGFKQHLQHQVGFVRTDGEMQLGPATLAAYRQEKQMEQTSDIEARRQLFAKP